MFGDAGHGVILLLAGIWMIMKENSLVKAAADSEIFGIFFGGKTVGPFQPAVLVENKPLSFNIFRILYR